MKDIPQPPDDNLTIRCDLRPGDLGAMVALHGTFYSEEYAYDLTFEGYVAQTLGHFARPYDPALERVWIAEAEGRPVGCIGIIRHSATRAQLRWFLVAPHMRGRGLGRRLLREAVAFARAAGYRSVFLDTAGELEAAASLYRAAGFIKTGEQASVLGGQAVWEQRYELDLQNVTL